MGFELGKEKRGFKNSKNVKIIEKKLDDGVKAEANNDGSVYVDHSIVNTKDYKKIVDHEMDHMKRMETGELDYGDDWVRWKSNTYQRKGGKILYNMKWHEEGDHNLPWEKLANK